MREANDKRVNITLSEKLLDQIDRRARRDGLSRSGLVREALEAYLAESSRLQVGQLRDQLEGAWAALGRARVLADWDRAPALDQASGWRMALQHAVVRLADTRIEWLVIGSAASALQGVEIEPRDVDLLFRTREDLMAFVRKMHGLTPSSPEAPLSVEDWRSSQAQPIKTETFPGAFTWHKAAWDIEGVRLDATAIENNGVPDSLHGDGVWEGGDHVWSFVTRAQDLPVVALEVQLESCLRRDLDSRARAIAVCLQHSGYAVERLVQVLSRGHLERVRKYLS
jgi:Arc/MetJ-type ribon-helix-helix transcriptional regulator